MITENIDGSLQYTKSDGTVVRATIFDANYSLLEQIMGKQNSAIQSNAAAKANYLFQLGVTQQQINQGITGAPLTKPLMTKVDDDGNDTQVPFDPPLPDPVPSGIPVIPSGGGDWHAGTPDYQKLTYQMLLAIYKKTFPTA